VVEIEKLNVGYTLPEITKEITYEKILGYSGRFEGLHLQTIHTDKSIAKDMGFPDVVCQGTMLLNYAFEMLFCVYKKFFLSGSKISVLFKRPVLPKETVTISGIVRERFVVDSSTKLKIEIWAANGQGENVMSGEAMVTIQ